jgi:hypothetical protein
VFAGARALRAAASYRSFNSVVALQVSEKAVDSPSYVLVHTSESFSDCRDYRSLQEPASQGTLSRPFAVADAFFLYFQFGGPSHRLPWLLFSEKNVEA